MKFCLAEGDAFGKGMFAYGGYAFGELYVDKSTCSKSTIANLHELGGE